MTSNINPETPSLFVWFQSSLEHQNTSSRLDPVYLDKLFIWAQTLDDRLQQREENFTVMNDNHRMILYTFNLRGCPLIGCLRWLTLLKVNWSWQMGQLWVRNLRADGKSLLSWTASMTSLGLKLRPFILIRDRNMAAWSGGRRAAIWRGHRRTETSWN